MELKKTSTRKLIFRSLVILLVVANMSPAAAQVEQANPALFYEELAPHGTWVNYENHGAVWQPKGVGQNWRPYQNGRWTPSEQGYIFETQEPWGWATYHYGNWMPTQQHGWVWKPGRTWYPHTCAWKSNEEYVGWAPVPPEGYEPSAGFGSADDMGGSEGMSSGGGGGGILNLLTAPFWIVAKAASFLLGFGQDYAPNYSYANSGSLMPYSYVPVIIGNMGYVDNYVSPSYAPQACYNWGPPIPYVSQVTQINSQTINNYIKTVNITKIANGAPSLAALQRRPYLRENWEGISRGLHDRSIRVNRVGDVRMAQRYLYNPNAQPLPRHLPPLPSELSRGSQNPSIIKAASGENSGQNWQWSRNGREEGRQIRGRTELRNQPLTHMAPEQRPPAGGGSGKGSPQGRQASWEPSPPRGTGQPQQASITPPATKEATINGSRNPGQLHPGQQSQLTNRPRDDRQKPQQSVQAQTGQQRTQQVQGRQQQAQSEQQRQQDNQRQQLMQHRRHQEAQPQQSPGQQAPPRQMESQKQQVMQQRQMAGQQQRQQQMAQQQQQQQQQQAQQERQRQMESQRQQAMQQRQMALQQQQAQQQQRQQQMVQQMQQRQQQMAQQRQQCQQPRPQQVVQQRAAQSQPQPRPQPQQQQQKKKHQQQ